MNNFHNFQYKTKRSDINNNFHEISLKKSYSVIEIIDMDDFIFFNMFQDMLFYHLKIKINY